jgi:hypothetical protein
MAEEFPLAPVAGYTSAPVSPLGLAFIRFAYLVSPMESPEQAHDSPNFALTAPQLRELGQRMLSLAEHLECSGAEGSELPKH